MLAYRPFKCKITGADLDAGRPIVHYAPQERDRDMNKAILFIIVVAGALAGCAVNYHVRPDGGCKTPGVSPFASNCPSSEDMKTHTTSSGTSR